MMDLQQRLAQLPVEKRALLERRLLKERDSTTSAIPPRGATETCPLSFAQQRLWFLDRLQPGCPAYHVRSTMQLSGPLHVEALEQSLEEIIRRHEPLRTAFPTLTEHPVQQITPASAFSLPVTDISALPPAEREPKLKQLAREEVLRPFDLARGPLFRAMLIREDAEEHVLVLTMHHIISDGWSMGVLYRELSALYRAFSTGEPSPLPELAVQYADYALWQRDRLHGERLEGQLAYWRQQLQGAPELLELPTDHRRPTTHTFRGSQESLSLSRGATEGLQELSHQEGTTLFMTLLAAFQVLLSRYTGQEDILIGTPIAGRTRVEIEGLIGFFVNTLVLRTDLSGDPTFRELLGRVREVALGAYAHQEIPFEKLVEELQPKRSLSHTPLFQVAFALQNAPRSPLQLSGLTCAPLKIGGGRSRFDLSLFMGSGRGNLSATLEYSTDLFEAGTIRRMLEQFQILLEGIVADPDRSISQLPLLTPEQRHQLLVEWNATETPYPREACIHSLFEQQVRQEPAAPAVCFHGQTLTYDQLNRRANQLAHHLRARGVGAEVRVGLCIERSLALIVGMLGILKAGGAYVPLDPASPGERLAFQVQDAQISLLLTETSMLERLPAEAAERIVLDEDEAAIARESEQDPENLTTAEHLAYVIYTSGSTGVPKGVAVTHRGVVRLAMNTNYVRLETSDVVGQAASASFDAATFEIWGPLLHGARLVGLPTEVVLSPGDLATQIREQGITTLFLTTALFNQTASAIPAAFRPLRHLLFGGEAVDPRWVREVLQHGPPERLLHVYGPTETTTFASWYVIEGVADGATTVPIGLPIANTQLYVLDQHLQPVPAGVPGELHIGGDGLAREYLNCPELTAQRFLPDPFSAAPGARLYKTGDRVRRRPDGNIEFLGRLDGQVKLRGYRIELGEIEAVLLQHPSVRESAVMVQQEGAERRLVAYVVGKEQGPRKEGLEDSGSDAVPSTPCSLSMAELRRFLQQRLPDYMVPSAFVNLPALPLTPSGKLDRRALPTPDDSRPELGHGFVAPRDPLETQLTRIWEELLGVHPLGVQDSFFDLGGHSLLAVQLLQRIENDCGTKLPLAILFQAPTVEQLANALRQEGHSASWSTLVPLQPNGAKPPLFIVSPGYPFFLKPLASQLAPDQPLYALQAPGLDTDHPPFVSVQERAELHIKEIRSVQPEGPYLLGGRCYGGIVAFEIARQLTAQGHRVALLVILDSAPPKSERARPPSGKLNHRWIAYYLRWILYNGHPRQLLQTVVKRVSRSFAGTPRADRLKQLEEENKRAIRGYYAPVFPGRITLMRSQEFAALERKSRHLQWSRFSARDLDVHLTPGTHIGMLKDPDVRSLAERLRACLETAGVDPT